jgi:hypothetical protein
LLPDSLAFFDQIRNAPGNLMGQLAGIIENERLDAFMLRRGSLRRYAAGDFNRTGVVVWHRVEGV